MKYALGNMLNGAGGLNADQLALDLQFATDKTLTARRGPTPILTRTNNVATFVGSNGLIQSAGTDIPRFDHDPVTLACRGLLIEEGRTNLAIRSSEPATWNLNGSSILNDATAPDGGVAKNIALGTNTFIGVGQNNGTAATANAVTTVSVFLKKDNNDWMRVQWISGSNIHVVNAWFNIGNGTLGSVSTGAGTPSNSSSSITPYPNGWYRCTVSASAPTTDPINGGIITASSNSSLTRVAGANITVWGAQIEAGSFSTSYIPTTTSTLARSADVCSITGGDFTNLWNASEGTMFINSTRLVTGTSFNPILSANDGTNNNRVAIGNSGGSSVREFLVVRLGTGEYSRSPSISADNRRMALAYSQTSTNSSDNASLGTDDTSSLIPSVTQLVIGAGQVIPAIRYYKKRLPNAKLQALTA